MLDAFLTSSENCRNIISGKYLWCIQPMNTRKRGKFALGSKETNVLYGVVTLEDVFSITKAMYEENHEKHGCNIPWSEFTHPYVWAFSVVTKYKNPILLEQTVPESSVWARGAIREDVSVMEDQVKSDQSQHPQTSTVLGYSNGREENPFVECRKQGLTYGEYTARKYAASQFSVKDSIQYAKKNGYMTYRERMRMKQEPGKN